MYDVKQKTRKTHTLVRTFATVEEAEDFITGTNYFIHFSADAIGVRNNPDQTFWEGKNAETIELLDVDIPVEGKVTNPERPVLEDWRNLQNAYYRYYNDGDNFTRVLSGLMYRYTSLNGIFHLIGTPKERLERLADAVFTAALREKLAA